MRLDLYLPFCTDINSKRANDLSVRPETLKTVKRKHTQYTSKCTGKDFLNMTLFAKKLRPTIDKWDLKKFKSRTAKKKNHMNKEEVFIVRENL